MKNTRRINRELTPEEQARLEQTRAQVEVELPQLIERQKLARVAKEEETFSGELRRRIHKSDFAITEIALRCGVDVLELDQFLTGERALSSLVINQLVELLGCQLVTVEPEQSTDLDS